MFSKKIFNAINDACYTIESARSERDEHFEKNKEVKEDLLLKSTEKMFDFFDKLIANLNYMDGQIKPIEIDIEMDMVLNDWKSSATKLVINPDLKIAYLDINKDINKEIYLVSSLDLLDEKSYNSFDTFGRSHIVFIGSTGGIRYYAPLDSYKRNDSKSDESRKYTTDKTYSIICTLLENQDKIEREISDTVIRHACKIAERYTEEKYYNTYALDAMEKYVLE